MYILTALNFYAHGSYQKNIGHDFNLVLSQPAVSNCITEVTNGLLDVMEDFIKFPSTAQEIASVKQQ
ncbi:hypothetical protein NQ314_014401 [Rhamnusium bicolor]|uniref:Transposase Helix-turn-helix domain-containing protein n=1 Tax=Rhamnusium bicolor TaxID=1586634 RepID=A0AAV8X2Q8_9CUCU|nr:hypothetical protein NQ314_014401 [Rhamnusium bicolor]